jgi:hypothetical protein
MRGLCPRAPGIYRFPPEWPSGAASAASHSGPGSALWSRPRVAVSSVQARPVYPPFSQDREKCLPKAPSVGYKYSCPDSGFYWPVLKWPRMAGFQVAAEGRE